MAGLLISVLSAYHVFLRHAKLWELQRFGVAELRGGGGWRGTDGELSLAGDAGIADGDDLLSRLAGEQGLVSLAVSLQHAETFRAREERAE